MVEQRRRQREGGLAAEALAAERRRIVLRCLREHGAPIALADLADEVAVREHEARLPEISAEATKRIYLSLYHCHVPKLVDADLVAYEQERDLVEAVDSDDLESVLETDSF